MDNLERHTAEEPGSEGASGESRGAGRDGGWMSAAYSPARIWKDKIIWRITTAVFATILLVQTVVLIFTAQSYESEQLTELRDVAHTALTFSLENSSEQLTSPLSKPAMEKLMISTPIEGIALYSLDYNLLGTYGVPTLLHPRIDRADFRDSYRSTDNLHYEIVFMPGDLSRPYHAVVKMDATAVQNSVSDYVRQTLWVLLLMSGFVTSVLMLALSIWLLEPITVLRDNLLSAAKNPEKPDIRRLRKELHDEVGIAIRIASDLIRQNASNLKRLRTQAEDKIHKLAYFDGLTGLPNRTYFLDQLEDFIKNKPLGEGDALAVLSVDLDHFKDINDTMGHEIGDKLLEAVGKRLVKALPSDAIVARASADEFTIMALIKQNQPGSASLAERIFASMITPVNIHKENFQVRVSIGVSQYPDDGSEASQILKNADIALNRAKEEGRDTVRYYSQDFDRDVQKRFQILRDLRNAMDQKQLQLFYHPQFDLKTGQLVGAEALLRWWRPDNSKEGGVFVPPAEFIPIAEQSGLIVPIGEYVLRTACETNKSWQKRGLPAFRMAVNISGVQFHRGDIVGLVAAILQETGLEPKWLELEVTESVFMENMQGAIDILNQLHRQGIELAVDDFGTGYSSLSYLRQFPIDHLKIDQSFIRNALVSPGDRMITKTIINLGHSLGLKVIAEGVESSEHEALLKEEGCDEAQGFKYSLPIPADKFWDFAIEYNRVYAKTRKLSVIE